MNVDRYLQRISLDREAVEHADASVLDRLQRAHVRPVPFENLCVVGNPTGDDRGEGISLALSGLSEKIVERRRGGLCFELNALFG